MYLRKLITVVVFSTLVFFLIHVVIGTSLIASLITGWIASGPMMLVILLIERAKENAAELLVADVSLSDAARKPS